MNVAERDTVLHEWRQSLRRKTVASPATYHGWHDMELLGKRIAQDHISSTADTKGAAATVVKAARLPSDVE